MRWVLCLMMLAALGFAPAPIYKPKAGPKQKDLALLQGKWVLVECSHDGKPVAGNEEGISVVVQEDVFEVRQNGSPDRYRVRLDESQKERTLELRDLGEPDSAGKPYRGLYRLEGDRFILCISARRGEAATSLEGGRGIRRCVFKRAPKP
jgi:uncharacterized protein (TIGR03067 family)